MFALLVNIWAWGVILGAAFASHCSLYLEEIPLNVTWTSINPVFRIIKSNRTLCVSRVHYENDNSHHISQNRTQSSKRMSKS